jgi:hypothetical protein
MVLLLGEYMLDTRADSRFRVVGSPYHLWHSAALWLLAIGVADEAVPYQERLVRR